jgi:hypothetical protein
LSSAGDTLRFGISVGANETEDQTHDRAGRPWALRAEEIEKARDETLEMIRKLVETPGMDDPNFRERAGHSSGTGS